MYKRYSNFVDLNEALMPYFLAEGIAPPKLPPKIANKNTSQRNLDLTKRKNQLQIYLRQVIISLIERAPAPLLIFLGLHEQVQFGFFGQNQIHCLSEINLREQAEAKILSNRITFVNNTPSTFYRMVLKFTGHSPLQTVNSAPIDL